MSYNRCSLTFPKTKMLYSILLIIALFVIFRLYAEKSKGLSPEKKKKMLRMWLFAAAAIAVAILAFAKGNVIAGAIASLVALFSRALPLLKFAPLLKAFLNKETNARQGQSGAQSPAVQKMDKVQAADILGVKIDASEDEIIAAHKRLIQKVHPDKGGSDALAMQINEAKKVLLND